MTLSLGSCLALFGHVVQGSGSGVEIKALMRKSLSGLAAQHLTADVADSVPTTTFSDSNTGETWEHCKCRDSDIKTPPHLNTESLQKAMRLRSLRYPYLKQFLETIYELQMTFFVRDGTLLAAIRNQGWTPWDYDFDLAFAAATPMQAKRDLQKLERVLKRKDEGWRKESHGDERYFTITHRDSGPWALADIRVIFRSPDQVKTGEAWWSRLTPDVQAQSPIHLPAKFLPETFSNITWTPFYSTKVPIAPNYEEYLDRVYGKDWNCVALNKCSRPNGALFKKNHWDCNMPVYTGATEYPLRTCGPAMQRGPLSEQSQYG